MPRKSAASLSVIPSGLPQRPPPPAELTPTQAGLWTVIVGQMPADYFIAGSWPLLVAYCRHVDTSNVLAGLINAIDPARLATDEVLARYGRLTEMAARETKAIASLSTKLRLAQSNRYDSKKRIATTPAIPWAKPWEKHT
jgi:hypothetical protein